MTKRKTGHSKATNRHAYKTFPILPTSTSPRLWFAFIPLPPRSAKISDLAVPAGYGYSNART